MKEIVAAVIKNDEGKILITKQNDMWKFPGGKIEIGETDEEALSRQVKQDLSIEISVNNYIAENENNMENVIVYDAQLEYGKIKLMENTEYKWVKKEELNKANISLDNQFIIKAIQGEEEEWN